jgi:hypothetical protein
MKNREEVINSLSELSNKMIMDKECIETYAKSLGYSINLDEEFNNYFQSELRKMYPVVKYMYNEPTWKRTLHLLKVTNISDVMLFVICNPEIYMVNRFYNIIEKIDSKKRIIKVERCGYFLTELMSCFNISFIEVRKQSNGKDVYYFDEENFNKVNSVIMYSNVYTTNAINSINDACKEAAKRYETYYDILKLVMGETELNNAFPYINKYLLKQALKS